MILHPGARVALARLGMNELGIARAIASGDLASPQRYHNISLYNIRITGTGVSYRPLLDEFVYRKPENYLTQDFLARIGGLPVIFVHPKKGMLNSKEFANRVVGAVMLPYHRGDEVWAVVRIYDDETIELLKQEQMSTSPGVLLEEKEKITLEDGTNALIEGDPQLVDHIALVSKGVWDKGGDATGIEQSDIRGDSAVAEKTKEELEREEKEKADSAARADAVRADADKKFEEKMDAILKGMDSMRSDMAACTSRMDAWEKEDKSKTLKDGRKDGTGDPEDLVADKARKDADEKEAKEKMEREDKARKDAAEKDKELEKLRADSAAQAEQLRALSSRIPLSSADAEYSELIMAQSRADAVFIEHGERAPAPLSGEQKFGYRRRIAEELKKHSPRWKDKSVRAIADDAVFEQIEENIYQDAIDAAKTPMVPEGKLIARARPMGAHTVIEYFGQPAAWMNEIAGPTRQYATGSFKTGSTR